LDPADLISPELSGASSSVPALAESYCLSCAYPLINLPENRCPECGRHFDPSDQRTYHRQLPESWWKHLGRILGSIERVGAWMSVLAIITAAILSAMAETDWVFPPLLTVGAVYLPFALAAALFGFEGLCRAPWMRLARAGIFCSLGISIIYTSWPLRLSFAYSRSSLEQLAAQVRAGQPPTVPVRAGPFIIRKTELRGNAVCLWTHPTSGSPKCFANCTPDEAIDRFNFGLFGSTSLADQWQWIVED